MPLLPHPHGSIFQKQSHTGKRGERVPAPLSGEAAKMHRVAEPGGQVRTVWSLPEEWRFLGEVTPPGSPAPQGVFEGEARSTWTCGCVLTASAEVTSGGEAPATTRKHQWSHVSGSLSAQSAPTKVSFDHIYDTRERRSQV